MYPILFQFPEFLPLIGGKAIHVYGVMVALGFVVGMIYIRRESARVGVDPEKAMDLFFYLIVAGIVGARILYFINSAKLEIQDPLAFFRVWEGGLVFQGGVIACVGVAIWYSRRHGIPFFRIGDIFAPALALGHGIGRIGCFFAGCCYGRQCDINFPLAVTFPHLENHGIAPYGVPLYPTQLFEAAGEFLIFTILLLYRGRKTFEGGVVLLYFIMYAVLRSIVETLRGDQVRGFIIEPWLSRAQGISLLMVLVAVGLWFYLKKNFPTQRGGKA